MTATENEPSSDAQAEGPVMPLIGHLGELRNRILRSVVVLVAACMGSFVFSDSILELLTQTARGRKFIFLSPIEPIMVKLKLSVLSGLIVAIPYLLFEAWSFARPGLKPTERRFSLLFVPPILMFFAAGALFSYFVVLPIGVDFFIEMAGPDLEPQLSIGAYSEFALMFILLFGLLAELPLVMLFLGKVGLVTSEGLAKRRATLIVGIFVCAAVFTPPDWVSQVGVALPVWLLFEFGLLGLRTFGL